MRYILLLVFVFSSVFVSVAQVSNDIGKISLSVVLPDSDGNLDEQQLLKISTKISQIVTSSGLASSGISSDFMIYPKFEIFECNVVEGGMQNITVIKAQLSLFVKQISTKMLFSSVTKTLKGSGSSKQQAVINAITQISPNEKGYKDFIDEGKGKIIAYYKSKCADIIKKADVLAKTQEYEQALSLLLTVPEEITDCYSKVQNKAVEIYKTFQNHKCSILIQKANALLAANDFTGALDIISNVDPSTSCFKEACLLAKKAEAKVSEQERRQWNLQVKMYNDSVGLEKQRINAIKDMVVSYNKSRPKTVNYNYIIN